MYKIAVLIVIGLAMLGTRDVQATMINFYADGVIQDGDQYTVVEIFNDATADMLGGLIETRVWIHDSGTFNVFGGTLDSIDIIVGDRGTVNLWNGVKPDSSPPDFHLAQIVGGAFAAINIYGYDFEQRGANLYGYWSDGAPFKLSIRDEQSWRNTTLYVIPEPAAVLLFSLGGLMVRRRNGSR